MNKPVLYISIGAVAAFLLSAIIVFAFNLVPYKNIQKADSINSTDHKNIFSSQTATINGTITDKKDTMVTVQSNDGISDTFALSSQLQISKFESAKSRPTVSTNPNDIEISKKASLILNYQNGNYEIVNITYIPDMPTPGIPPVKPSTQSATTR